MRIVFLNPLSEIGGAERNLLAWMGAVRRTCPHAQATLVVPSDGPLPEAAAAIGFAVELVPMPTQMTALGNSALRKTGRFGVAIRFVRTMLLGTPAGLAYLSRLRRAIRRLDPDVMHSNGIKMHLMTRLLPASRSRPQIIWHVQDFLGHRHGISKALRRAANSRVTAIGCSQSVTGDASEVILGTRTETVYNVTDVERFRPAAGASGQTLDTLAGLPPAEAGCVRVVLVATYARWKGQDAFLRAAGQVIERGDGRPMRFYVVGGPIYQTVGSQFSREELRDVASAAGISERVGFIDFQRDPAPVYQAADVVVHASTRPEPFGLTIVEAMACGKAVIVSAAGGAAELFADGVDGVGVPPGNVEALAEVIERLAGDAALRERLGAAARESVVRRFDQRGLPGQVAALYGGVLERPIGGGG